MAYDVHDFPMKKCSVAIVIVVYTSYVYKEIVWLQISWNFWPLSNFPRNQYITNVFWYLMVYLMLNAEILNADDRFWKCHHRILVHSCLLVMRKRIAIKFKSRSMLHESKCREKKNKSFRRSRANVITRNRNEYLPFSKWTHSHNQLVSRRNKKIRQKSGHRVAIGRTKTVWTNYFMNVSIQGLNPIYFSSIISIISPYGRRKL